MTDPLAPAVQGQSTPPLDSRLRRIADEPEVRVEAAAGERFGETDDPRRDSAGARIQVGPLEREQVELPRDR